MSEYHVQTFLDVEISGDFLREDRPLRHEVSEVANAAEQSREVAVDVQDRLREVEDAHGGAPVLVDVRPAVDPVHVLVPAADDEVAARDDFGGEIISRRRGEC